MDKIKKSCGCVFKDIGVKKPIEINGWAVSDWKHYFTPDNCIEILGGFITKDKENYKDWIKYNKAKKVRIVVYEYPHLTKDGK